MPVAADNAIPLTLLELVTIFRQESDDLPGDTLTATNWENNDADLLWSNSEVVRYANEAYIEAARIRPIRDDTTAAVCRIATVIGTGSYAYHSKILSIRRVKYTETGASNAFILDKNDHQQLDAAFLDWQGRDGSPVEYIDNTNERTLYLSHKPELTGTLDLVVDRLPLTNLRWTHRYTDTPEISSEHHYDLVFYMLYRAYMKHDSEIYDRKAAQDNLAIFQSRVGERASAHLERVRKEERNIRRRAKPHFF